jgi:hypothetical protein
VGVNNENQLSAHFLTEKRLAVGLRHQAVVPSNVPRTDHLQTEQIRLNSIRRSIFIYSEDSL